MARNVLYEVTVCQLHHVFSAAFLGLTTYMLVTWTYLISNFIETLNTTNSKRCFLSPNFDCNDSRIRYFSNYCSICKSLSFLSCKSLLVVLEVCLIWNGLLIWTFNFVSRGLYFLFWFLFALFFVSCEVSFDVIFSHLYLKFIDLLL